MVRALDCHSRGRGFEPRRSRNRGVIAVEQGKFGVQQVSESTAGMLSGFALVVELVDTLL